MITTLEKIRSHDPCRDGWERLLRHLGKTQADDEPLSIVTILESNGLDDALWCLRAADGHDREIQLYAVWCARQVQHLMADPRSVAAVDAAERYARGRASNAESIAARAEAWTATAAAAMAWAARAEAWTATAAAAGAWAARAAASAAAAASGAWAARAAASAASAALGAWAAAQDAQAAELRRVCLDIEAGRDPYPEENKR